MKDKTEARRLLQHLGRPSEPPKVAPARDPTLDQIARHEEHDQSSAAQDAAYRHDPLPMPAPHDFCGFTPS